MNQTDYRCTDCGASTPLIGAFVCPKCRRQAFHDRADAVAAAEAMRLRKIAAVKRQLAKLETMRFE